MPHYCGSYMEYKTNHMIPQSQNSKKKKTNVQSEEISGHGVQSERGVTTEEHKEIWKQQKCSVS